MNLLSTYYNPSQSAGSPGYEMGNVACTGLDLNCHGFTEFMCEERVEYAWLMQLQVGRIMGGVSSEQVSEPDNRNVRSCACDKKPVTLSTQTELCSDMGLTIFLAIAIPAMKI